MAVSPNHPESSAETEAKIREAFGVVLRQLRVDCGLSQRELAAHSGMSGDFISRLERGARLPALTTLYRLAPTLGVTVGEIADRIDSQNAQHQRKAKKARRG